MGHAGTNRFRWYDDDTPRPLGPQAGFKDYLRYRKNQGFNCVPFGGVSALGR